MTEVDVVANLESVQKRIRAAELRGGRQPGSVKLVAVTKKVPVEQITKVLEAGISDLGENRVQELMAKQEQLPGANWHLIGHLQTNKVKYVINKTVLIHSLDRWKLAETIHRLAAAKGLTVDVLVQVNISGEETKYGLSPNEVEDFITEASQLSAINIRGLMTMAPYVDNPEEVRPIFKELYTMRQKLAEKWPHIQLTSMGMTNDFEVAVEEGADIVRVGSAIFRA
ncbi:pyridoxal phosphate enzyme (YggS family) [Desulfohalotomaculum tongense]|uniref:YggS family pyridoxal phosphate-dependent enzyme n=1 Tax=Desulforadius tongensis TaxID=1216062 RepID=UPI00195F1CD3|nr:YggS family pyridoxal phosphate-dependent enzyme [Desulforadius tongensis]MBM7855240.1 pyridoxal phosphate enzyme (YggS family) [Desulforadius tongensis]